MKKCIDRFRMTSQASINLGKTPEAFGEENLAMYASRRRGWQLGIVLALGIGGVISQTCDRALAQSNIVPDRTLGNENSVVVPNFNGLPVEVIQGGAARGQNLFHSFREFNVSTGRGAYFFSPNSNIQNILTRVTGNNPSQILGTLGTFGNSQPNLFLINPNGIIFGQNASLDIGGSFVATTANAMRFGNTGLFSASEPQTSNLLSINPSAFFFNAFANQGQIVNRSTATSTVLGAPTSGLQVPDGRSLLLVGGDVKLDGGRLFAPGGRVELGGVAHNGTVELNANGNELRLSFPTDVARADVSLINESEVNVRAGGGGSIAINAQNIDVLQGSKLRAGIASGLGSPDSKAGDIEINATETMTVAGELSFLANVVQSEGVGNGGNVNITTGLLFVSNGASLSTSTFGQGKAGSVRIRASDTVRFDGGDAFSNVEAGAVGDGGDVEIITGFLEVTKGAQLITSTSGQGNAGSVRIRASDTVLFDGVSSNGLYYTAAFSDVDAGAVGNGGDIEITTGSLSVRNGAALIASTSGQGNAGNVMIRATDIVSFDGVGSNRFIQGASSKVNAGAVGNGGDIEITTGSLSVSNGAALNAITSGQGNAGNVRISASDTVNFDGGGAFSFVGTEAAGEGGDVEIITGSLEVTIGALLSTGTSGQGNAGSVRISASDTVNFDGSTAESAVFPGGVGNGGAIEITTGSLEVTNGASLLTSTSGQGNAGSVRISASDTVNFDGGTAESAVLLGGVGNGGNIEITTDSLEVTDRASLLTSTQGQGNAGSVRIRASDTVNFDRGYAFSPVAREGVGNGGDIEITTGSLELTNGAFLLTSTQGQGNAGSVRISASDTVNFDRGSALSGVLGGVGNAGNVRITANSISLTDAYISSESLGTNTAGEITLQTRQNLETNHSQIVATTQSGDGGNINLQVGDVLLMRNNSKISTTAGIAGAGGNGGNINISADFVATISKENSDITANAFNGRGGNINITTQGIYGLKYRERETPLSDITASSQFGVNGEFQLDLLTNVDPSRGLAELPTDVVDATQQIDRRCTPRGGAQERSSFTITGRGGLPPSPNDPLQGEAVVTNWVSLDSDRENNTPPAKTKPRSSAPRQLVEAQGWVINEKGQVVLTASSPKVTPQSEWLSPPECNSPRSAKTP